MEKANEDVEGSGRYLKYVIMALIVALIFLVYFLVRDYRSLRRQQIIGAQMFVLNSAVEKHGHLTMSAVADVRSWMTFDYIDRLFGIPADYLRSQLSITDPHYPKLSLSSYAKSQHVPSTTVVSEVEAALKTYFMNATSTVSPTSTLL